VPGTSYLLSYWMFSDGEFPNEFRVSWGGATISDLTNIPGAGYTQYTFVVMATGTSTTLQFGGRSPPGYLLLDDVSVLSLGQP
jgi:hypothetical protein